MRRSICSTAVSRLQDFIIKRSSKDIRVQLLPPIEALQNRIVADLAFGDITGDIDVALGDIPITATAPGNVGAIQFEGTLATVVGGRVNYYLSELAGEIVGTPVRFDRRPIETVARLTFFHSSTNHRLVDLYVVDADATIEDTLPRAAGENDRNRVHGRRGNQHR